MLHAAWAIRPCLYHREKHTIVSYNRTRRGYGHYDFTICPLSGRVWFCILLPGRSTSWLEHATTYLGRCNIVPWHLDPQNSFPTTDSSNILVPITSSGTILWYHGVFFLWYRHGLMEVSLGQYGLELTLNHDMSDIFGQSCDLNIQSLAPSQDCITLWDYLKGLSPALQVLSFDGRQLQLHCHNKPKMTKWFKVHPVEIGMFSTE